MSNAIETHRCDSCNATSNVFPQRLTPGCVQALVKFRRAIQRHRRNSIHLYRDMDDTPFALTTTEKMNWTKLRFHGLVAKVREDGQVRHGYWLLTEHGRRFLDGQESCHQMVKTMNNRVVERGDLYMMVEDIMSEKPVFDDHGFWHANKAPQEIDLAQTRLVL